jgi:uncharacterized membrane protein YgdD (TMEM256/DUF423 family)
MERKNIIVGVVLVLLFLVLGAYLESQLGAGILWKTSPRHGLWKMAHIHGIGFGILNILFGLLVKNYGNGKNIANLGGYLAIAGSLLPIGLFLAGIQSELKFLAPVGGFSMVLAWFVLTYTVVTKK